MNPQLLEVVHGRHNPGIDPGLHAWGWEVPVYLFLGGLVAGLMILIPLLERRTGRVSPSPVVRFMPVVALALISLGMGALFLDLEYKLHVFRFYLSFEPTSPMSWGAWILMGVYPALGLYALGGFTAEDRKRLMLGSDASGLFGMLRSLADWAQVNRQVIGTVTMALGVGLGTYTGLLLGTLSARLLWSTALLGPLFMVSGVSTGAALLLLSKPSEEEQHVVTRWDALAIGVELAILLVMILAMATGGTPQRAAVDVLMGGAYTPHFWALVVGAGLIAPLALELVELKQHRTPTFAAPALVLVGGFALRFILVAAGQATSFSMLG
ncbi:MAG: polysulfide reductase NrfD [Myxococcales bacterium]|nr:polysulfide reductase NrfD [Myxococcales bacterium]